MSFLFGKKESPAPAPLPEAPSASEDAQKARQAAQDAALRNEAGTGRRQTIVAGMKLAEEEQGASGLMRAKRRAASRELVG